MNAKKQKLKSLVDEKKYKNLGIYFCKISSQ